MAELVIPLTGRLGATGRQTGNMTFQAGPNRRQAYMSNGWVFSRANEDTLHLHFISMDVTLSSHSVRLTRVCAEKVPTRFASLWRVHLDADKHRVVAFLLSLLLSLAQVSKQHTRIQPRTHLHGSAFEGNTAKQTNICFPVP